MLALLSDDGQQWLKPMKASFYIKLCCTSWPLLLYSSIKIVMAQDISYKDFSLSLMLILILIYGIK
jgi:hypothetical protein